MSFTHHEVAHRWAHQIANARTGKLEARGRDMFYRGDTIFSYGTHIPIARLIWVGDKNVVLMTTRSYSVSTLQHKSISGQACPHLTSYRVENVLASSEAAHMANAKEMYRVVTVRVAQAMRRRKAHLARYDLAVADALYDEYSRYLKRFALARRKPNYRPRGFDYWFANLATGEDNEQHAEGERQAEREKIRQYRGEDGWGSEDPERVIGEPEPTVGADLAHLEGEGVTVFNTDGKATKRNPKAQWRKINEGMQAAPGVVKGLDTSQRLQEVEDDE